MNINFAEKMKYKQYYIKYDNLIQRIKKEFLDKHYYIQNDIEQIIPSGYLYTNLIRGSVELKFIPLHKTYMTYDTMLKMNSTDDDYYYSKWSSTSYFGSKSEAQKEMDDSFSKLYNKDPKKRFIGCINIYSYKCSIMLVPIIHYIYENMNKIYFLRISVDTQELHNFNKFESIDINNLIDITKRYKLNLYTEEELKEKNERLNS